jgi:prephenate dehydrogenase
MAELAPRTILVVGCGLIGTSFALAAKQRHPDVRLFGVEANAAYRRIVEASGVFQEVFADLPEAGHFDWAVLATPVDVACRQLPTAAQAADIVLDVCSVKRDICKAAEELGLTERFAPTHPMAGLAAAGPSFARSDLFAEQRWITFPSWPACSLVDPFLASLGAKVVHVPSPEAHDAAMAAVSHGIHLTSVAAMLACDSLKTRLPEDWASLTGPAFADVTRLCASPSGFWVSTLAANRENVLKYIGQLKHTLAQFEQALNDDHRDALAALLDQARRAHHVWREERG